jgi:hypothetical protein
LNFDFSILDLLMERQPHLLMDRQPLPEGAR